LAAGTDKKSQAATIRDIVRLSTCEELRWICRIILKDLKIGLTHERLLFIFHSDAPDFYNSTSSLRDVCIEFVDKNHSLKNVLRLFHPIKPMLSGKRGFRDIQALFEGKLFLIETKYDGERI
jgi:DNA ligase-4